MKSLSICFHRLARVREGECGINERTPRSTHPERKPPMAQHTTPTQKPEKQPDKGRTGDQAHDPRTAKPRQDHPESTDRGRDRNPGDAKRDEKGAEQKPSQKR